METINTILGIIASIFAIISTIISIKNYNEIKVIKNNQIENRMYVNGNENNQVIGNQNSIK
ncbi:MULTISPECIES: hypothetical protein [Streptococcus]|jgi:hypothetical protein|uniref:Uncharacterized protein n=1 Tax=Streptococcus salivarius TaxID=1304 RepID=A0A074IT35_STRSL|nr:MULTISPECIES: hypothetical protein [Streptococcus]KEO43110.1 hypothetical protein DL08_08790 [Streptococcus salivarius]KEO43240.1 hypothetical protein DL07_06955 [Streptococcus salivarius]MBK5025042.1 hypothetical protein [Streptococcus sp. 17.1]MBK5158477.1 hypothetical protein [Streptococcus sp. 23.2]MDU3422094.1 hypothetical protein [Streptococcus sp.]